MMVAVGFVAAAGMGTDMVLATEYDVARSGPRGRSVELGKGADVEGVVVGFAL